jgi:hypothetical protein
VIHGAVLPHSIPGQRRALRVRKRAVSRRVRGPVWLRRSGVDRAAGHSAVGGGQAGRSAGVRPPIAERVDGQQRQRAHDGGTADRGHHHPGHRVAGGHFELLRADGAVVRGLAGRVGRRGRLVQADRRPAVGHAGRPEELREAVVPGRPGGAAGFLRVQLRPEPPRGARPRRPPSRRSRPTAC